MLQLGNGKVRVDAVEGKAERVPSKITRRNRRALEELARGVVLEGGEGVEELAGRGELNEEDDKDDLGEAQRRSAAQRVKGTLRRGEHLRVGSRTGKAVALLDKEAHAREHTHAAVLNFRCTEPAATSALVSGSVPRMGSGGHAPVDVPEVAQAWDKVHVWEGTAISLSAWLHTNRPTAGYSWRSRAPRGSKPMSPRRVPSSLGGASRNGMASDMR